MAEEFWVFFLSSEETPIHVQVPIVRIASAEKVDTHLTPENY
jgi:hypothetical protein